MLNSVIKNNLWRDQNSAYDNLMRLEHRTATAVFGRDRLKHAVSVHPKTVKCIDERVVLDHPTLGLAGSGVLLSDTDFIIVSKKLKTAGVKLITYHEHCGACSLFCADWKKSTGQNRNAINVARESAQKLNHKLGGMSAVHMAGYSDKCHIKMTGDPRLHHARAIMIDYSGKLNVQELKLPASFLISAAYHPSINYTLKEIGIALSIAFGTHGFGAETFSRTPLAVVCIGSPEQINAHKTIVTEATKPFNQATILLDLAIM